MRRWDARSERRPERRRCELQGRGRRGHRGGACEHGGHRRVHGRRLGEARHVRAVLGHAPHDGHATDTGPGPQELVACATAKNDKAGREYCSDAYEFVAI